MEVFTLEGLRRVYQNSIDGLTKTQIEAIESGNEGMIRISPRMRVARSYWERLQAKEKLQEDSASCPQILLRP